MPTLFSKIIAGAIPSYKIFEDEWTLAFLTRDAVRLGHTLVIPKLERDQFNEVPEPYYSAIFKTAKPLAFAIQEVTRCRRVGAVFAGWDVPHCHYHLVPLFEPQDLDLHRGKPYPPADNLAMQTMLTAALKKYL